MVLTSEVVRIIRQVTGNNDINLVKQKPVKEYDDMVEWGWAHSYVVMTYGEELRLLSFCDQKERE